MTVVVLVALVVVAAFAAAIGVIRTPLPSAGSRAAERVAPPPRRLLPPVPPPAVEPLVVLAMTPDRARAVNAAVPFATGPVLAARPFRYTGGEADRERALTCLAGAAWYEAGDDAVGQRAVVQVVLNRVRHPAYPKTVCGVVFQGAERVTGCQFTFTCDGSLARRPSAAAWERARMSADRALSGLVDQAVGTATSYHTDWVVPYWSSSLDKIAEVHTHLFFRWRGWWGTPAAFSGQYAGGEPMDPRIAYLAGAAAVAPPVEAAAVATMAEQDIAGQAPAAADRPRIKVEGVSAASLKGSIVRLANDDGTEFALELDARARPDDYALAARALCRARPACIVAGWIRPTMIPLKLPVPVPALRVVTFLYRRNVELGRDQTFWNCLQVPRDDAAQCLPGTDSRLLTAGSSAALQGR